MMTIEKMNRILALLLVLILIFTSCLPFIIAFADSNEIVITTKEDFIDFAKSCKTDTWSQGKTFILKNDIDLSETEFSCVPTFGGVFKGNGYSISGVKITKKGSYLGLFRYIQNCGSVDGINVYGEVTPEGSKKNIGGIAGQNSGVIKNCTFNGNVSGSTNVGGVCGYVTQTGVVSDCSYTGSIMGKNYTGGIAGQNYGTVKSCENNGKVNTSSDDEPKSIQDIKIDVKEIGTTEVIDTATDTGGICGFSKGNITDCKNSGDVGYKSVGYNVGGICGRQSGFINNCQNYGTINGRKDIGGICGQAEPYILLEYTQDAIEQLDDVLYRMQSIIDDNDILKDNELNDCMDNIDSMIGGVTASIKPISDDLNSYLDTVTSIANDLSDRVYAAVDESSEALDLVSDAGNAFADGMLCIADSGDYIKEAIDSMEESIQAVEEASGELSNSALYLQKASAYLSKAFSSLEEDSEKLKEGSKKLRESINALSNALKEKKEIEKNNQSVSNNLYDLKGTLGESAEAYDEIANILTGLSNNGYLNSDMSETIEKIKALAKCYKEIASAMADICEAVLILGENFDIYSISYAFRMFSRAFDNLSNASASLRNACNDLNTAMRKIQDIGEPAEKAVDKIKDGVTKIGEGADKLKEAVDKLSDITDKATEGGKITLPTATEAFGDDFDNLINKIEGLQDEFSALNDIFKKKKNMLSDEVSDISNEFDALSDVFSQIYDDNIGSKKADLIDDISDNDTPGDTRGKVVDSLNQGEVYGDVNVGGIVGFMAVEYDFDPEDDIKNNGDKSLKFTYKTKCVIRRCKNEAKVNSKNNYCGGVVGRMDLGSILLSENYGELVNSDGDYTGGIAGMSDTSIKKSASKCKISGKDYVGGIAGMGKSISECYSIVHIPDYNEFAGSIAGYAENDTLNDNFFVNDTLGGIDDINYTGVAAETSVEDFVKFVKSYMGTDVKFVLTFVVDDKVIAQIPFTYNSKIPDNIIPKVPEKSGYYGKWSDYDFEKACYDETIRAEYFRNIEMIESDYKREDGRSVILVCGAFNDAAKVAAGKANSIPQKIRSKNVVDGCEVKISGTYTEKYTVRYLPISDKKNVSLYIDDRGNISKVKSKKVGSYLEFEVTNDSFNVYEVQESVLFKIITIVTSIILFAVILLIGIKKYKKRQLDKKPRLNPAKDD